MVTQRRLNVLLTIALSATLTTGAFAQGNGNGRGNGGGGGGGGDRIPPAAIIDLSVSGVTHNSLALTWTATGDDGLEGLAESYDLRYALFQINLDNWNDATQASGEPTPGAPGTLEQYTLADGLPPDTAFSIAVRVSDEKGNVSDLSNVVVASTGALPSTPWSTSLVDAQNDPGRWSSVAFNPMNGFPAVAYQVAKYGNRRNSFEELYFSSWNGSSWVRSEMIAPAFGWIDLEFDPNTGMPFIAFKCGAEVHVAWQDGGGWQAALVDQSFSTSHQVSLEFDPEGRPTLAYAAVTQSGATIRFARLVEGVWQTEDIGTVGPRRLEHSFDPVTGHPAIASNFNVPSFSFFDGSQWITEIIDATEVFAVLETRLEFNPISGAAMVVYEEWPSFDPLIGVRIRLCERTVNGSWMCSDVNDPDDFFPSLGDFAVDSAGVPLVLYNVSGELIFTWWDDSTGTWIEELVFPGEEFTGFELSLDIGLNGDVAATFQRDGEGDERENELIIGIR